MILAANRFVNVFYLILLFVEFPHVESTANDGVLPPACAKHLLKSCKGFYLPKRKTALYADAEHAFVDELCVLNKGVAYVRAVSDSYKSTICQFPNVLEESCATIFKAASSQKLLASAEIDRRKYEEEEQSCQEKRMAFLNLGTEYNAIVKDRNVKKLMAPCYATDGTVYWVASAMRRDYIFAGKQTEDDKVKIVLYVKVGDKFVASMERKSDEKKMRAKLETPEDKTKSKTSWGVTKFFRTNTKINPV